MVHFGQNQSPARLQVWYRFDLTEYSAFLLMFLNEIAETCFAAKKVETFLQLFCFSTLWCQLLVFAALTQGRFSTLSFCFSDEAWRLLPGETSINSRKNISVFYRRNIKKKVQSS